MRFLFFQYYKENAFWNFKTDLSVYSPIQDEHFGKLISKNWWVVFEKFGLRRRVASTARRRQCVRRVDENFKTIHQLFEMSIPKCLS